MDFPSTYWKHQWFLPHNLELNHLKACLSPTQGDPGNHFCSDSEPAPAVSPIVESLLHNSSLGLVPATRKFRTKQECCEYLLQKEAGYSGSYANLCLICFINLVPRFSIACRFNLQNKFILFHLNKQFMSMYALTG